MIIAETERLLFREMTPADASNAYHLNVDPDVIQYTGDRPFANIEEAESFLTHYDHYRKYGYGRWAVVHKTSMEFLGWCGLKFHEDAQINDVGFRFMKKYWNQGFATEAAMKCLDLGFHQFKMPFIAAHADIENKASIRVLEKIGLTFVKYYFEGERECAAYRIDKIILNSKINEMKPKIGSYSSTPLIRKLGIKEDSKIRIINCPESYQHLIGKLPEGVVVYDDQGMKKNMIHFFIISMNQIEREILLLKNEIVENGCIWISWYKKSSRIPTDVTEDKIRELAIRSELVDVKVCSINEQWSGLKLVIPLSKRRR